MHTRIAILLCLLFCQVKGQVNLVPNSSFEDTIQCIDFSGQINRVAGWSTPTNGSPDIISENFCNVYLNSNIIKSPSNIWGYQSPRTGNNYAGIAAYTNNSGSLDREYIQIKLTESLKSSVVYCVRIYVSLSDNSSYYAIKNIGASLTLDSTYIYSELPYLPVLTYPPVIEAIEIISDTINWVEISGNYTASGGEKYLIIGCFASQMNVDTLLFNTFDDNKIAYYYIDDVSVYECDSTVDVEEYLKENIKVYPNPAQDFVSIDIPTNYLNPQLSIYNLTGQLVAQKQITSNQQIPITELGNGMYIFVIQSGGNVIDRHRVVVAR